MMAQIGLFRAGLDSFIDNLHSRLNEENRVWTAASVFGVVANYAMYAVAWRFLGQDASVFLNYFLIGYVVTSMGGVGRDFISYACLQSKDIMRHLLPTGKSRLPVYTWALLISAFDATWMSGIIVLISMGLGSAMVVPTSSLLAVGLAIASYAMFQAVVEMVLVVIISRSTGMGAVAATLFSLLSNFISGMYFPIEEFRKVSNILYSFASVYPGHLLLSVARDAISVPVDPVVLMATALTIPLGVFLISRFLGFYWGYVVENDLWEERM